MGSKPELKIIENKINLGYSIKWNDITYDKEQIILINIFIKIKRKLSKDNSFGCYPGEEINYPELIDEEAFDKAYKELGLHDIYAKNIYYEKNKPKMPKVIIETNFIMCEIIIKEKWYLLKVYIILMMILLRYIIMNI